MSEFKVERDWTTEAGFRAVVIMGHMGFRCGYVGIPPGHALHGVDYSADCDALTFPSEEPIGKRGLIALLCSDGKKASPEIVFDVHGGLTYSGGKSNYPVESDGLWWFGYDCGHAGDATENEGFRLEGYEIRSLDYCSAECESLAEQMNFRVSA